MKREPGSIVSTDRLAVLLDVDPTRVRQLAKSGVLRPMRSAGRALRFDAAQAVAAYVKYRTSRDTAAIAEIRADRERVGLERDQIELETLRGERITRDEHERILAAVCGVLRAGVVTFADRAAPALAGGAMTPAEVKAKLIPLTDELLVQLGRSADAAAAGETAEERDDAA